jgi:uncharacterized protein
MAAYVVRYDYDPASAAERAAQLGAHRSWLAALDADGRLLTAGAFADGSGAVLAISAADAGEAAAVMDGDPFRSAGLVADRSIDEWNIRWGPLAS